MRLTHAATIALAACASVAAGSTFSDYSVVISGAYTSSSHTDGPAIAGSFNAQNWPVMQGLSVVGNVNGNMHLNGGVLRVGGSINGTVNYNGGSYRDNTATAASIQNTLNLAYQSAVALSDQYRTVADSSGASWLDDADSNNARFRTGGGTFSVFNLTEADFANSNTQFLLDVADATTTIVLNVDAGADGAFTLNNNINFGTDHASKIVWNFFNATSLTLNKHIQGSILAVNANVLLNNVNIDGSIAAASLVQNGEIHKYLFNGSVPPPMVPTPLAASSGLAALGVLAARRRRAA